MDAYDELTQLMELNPELVFCNDGYENLPKSVVDVHKDAITDIEVVLQETVKGFVRFQNFKPRTDGSTAVRLQAHYNDEGSFTGVMYIPLISFKGLNQ
jgi:hypothetical protein